MKRSFLRIFSLVLCAALLSVPAFAAEEGTEEAPARPGLVRVWGTLTHLEDGGLLVEDPDDSGSLSTVILHGESIICLDAVTGDPMETSDLRDGETVYAWVGPAMTMSLPPHTTAYLILGNIPADYDVPQLYEIAAVTPQVMAAIYPAPAMTWTEVTATDGTTLKITDEAELMPYLTKNVVRLEDLIPGTRILVWEDAQGGPERVLVFPYAYRGYMTCSDEGVVSVNGQVVSQDIKTAEDGTRLLPIRAVAEALGMDVRWDPAKGAVVAYREEGQTETADLQTLFTAMPGGAIMGVSETGETYEVAGTCVKEAGVTYLSISTLANLLDLYLA